MFNYPNSGMVLGDTYNNMFWYGLNSQILCGNDYSSSLVIVVSFPNCMKGDALRNGALNFWVDNMLQDFDPSKISLPT